MPLPRRAYSRICGALAPSGGRATQREVRRRVPASRSPSSAAVHDSCGAASDCKPAARRTGECAAQRSMPLSVLRSRLVRAHTPKVEIEGAAIEVGCPVVAVREQRGDTHAIDQGGRRTVHAAGYAAEARTVAADLLLESAVGEERPGAHVEVAAEI